MAEVWLIHPDTRDVVVEPPTAVLIMPQQSQSPAVKLIVVISALVLVVNDVPGVPTELEINSPTEPAAASLFVVVPIIPDVLLKDKLVADTTPNVGVTSVGELEPTKAPVPVWPLSVVSTIFLAVTALSLRR